MTFIQSLISRTVLQRILPVFHDLVADDMRYAALDPVLRFIRLLCEIRAILGIEVVTSTHMSLGEEILTKIDLIIPVSSPLFSSPLHV